MKKGKEKIKEEQKEQAKQQIIDKQNEALSNDTDDLDNSRSPLKHVSTIAGMNKFIKKATAARKLREQEQTDKQEELESIHEAQS